jgi:hypothetical protein
LDHFNQLTNYNKFNSKISDILKKLSSLFNNNKINILSGSIKDIQLDLLKLMLFISNCLVTFNEYRYCDDKARVFSNNIDELDEVLRSINEINAKDGDYTNDDVKDINVTLKKCVGILQQISIGINPNNNNNTTPNVRNINTTPVLTKQVLQTNINPVGESETSSVTDTIPDKISGTSDTTRQSTSTIGRDIGFDDNSTDNGSSTESEISRGSLLSTDTTTNKINGNVITK